MSENLANFLIDLASDPERMARFATNPGLELDASLLTAEEKAAVIAGDSDEIRRVLHAQAAGKRNSKNHGNRNSIKDHGKRNSTKDHGRRNSMKKPGKKRPGLKKK